MANAGKRQVHLALGQADVDLLNRLGTDLDTENVSEVVRRAVKACDAVFLAATPSATSDGDIRVRGRVHVRVPDSVADAVNAACVVSGATQSEVVVHALARLMALRDDLSASMAGRDGPIPLRIDPDILAGFASGRPGTQTPVGA